MKRLTIRTNEASISFDLESVGDIVRRLATIEDILGDEYDLDRLRELVQADKSEKTKAYILDGFYCDICQKWHRRVKEIEVYLNREDAEAAVRRKQDG